MFPFNLSSPLAALEQPWSDAPQERLSRSGHRVVSVFLGSIMVLGFLNNLLVLVLFCRFKTLRTPVNMLLLNISISDMLVCVCGTTLSFASSLRSRWLYGRHGCMWYGFINSCFGLHWVTYCLLSFDHFLFLVSRYRVPDLPVRPVLRPVLHPPGVQQRAPDYRRPLLAVGGSWLYSVVWTVPPLLGWSSYGLEGAGTSCSVTWTDRSSLSHSYIVCLFVFCLGLPVLIMVYCYGRLLHAVKQVGQIRRTAARRREFHILFMVVTTVVCYLLCWMPYGVVAMLATFGRPGLISPVASVIPSILAKSSTVINPVIYILMNKQFYRCFLILFHCEHHLSENGHTSLPSKSTMVHLNRRVVDSGPFGPAPPVSQPCAVEAEGTSGVASDRMDPAEPPDVSS
ncbi:hypothetical protein INR49_022796 [Caranx melampygus]|nr:hypothetical protein INR49_022796 [Caranx melampygus]